MLSRDYFVAGEAVFTLTVPVAFAEEHVAQGHYTFRVRHSPANVGRDGRSWPESWFCELLTGPDNENDYTYLGMLNPQTGGVRTTTKSRHYDGSLPHRLLDRCLRAVWDGRGEQIEAAGFELRHNGCCSACGRTLTEPLSLDLGIGPVCREKLAAA